MLKTENSNFYNTLYSNNKIFNLRDSNQKNISEELLTIRTLVLTVPLQNTVEELGQLEKIMVACKLQNKDYKVQSVINNWSHYRNYANIREVLLLGITEKDLGLDLHFLENKINKFDKRVFIKTASIAQMQSNQQIKNDLWQNALKPHFC